MAQIAENLSVLSKLIYTHVGFGNFKLRVAFCLSTTLLCFLLFGVAYPNVAASMNWMLILTLGAFAGLSVELFLELRHQFGLERYQLLLCGVFVGVFVYATCMFLIYISPLTTALLLLPNVVAAGLYGLGQFLFFVESVYDAISNCNLFNTNNEVSADTLFETSPNTSPEATMDSAREDAPGRSYAFGLLIQLHMAQPFADNTSPARTRQVTNDVSLGHPAHQICFHIIR